MKSVSSQSPCQKRVGFLFPRICGRTTSLRCPHCQGGTITDDPFFLQPDHRFYPDYGRFEVSELAVDLDLPLMEGIDFTEADAMNLQNLDLEFETDMGAS